MLKMDYVDAVGKLAVSLIIGAVIGLERESQEKPKKTEKVDIPNLVGIRTFSLITVLGTIAGLLYMNFFSVFIFISTTFAAILISYYLLHSFFARDAGFTTELGILYSYLIGIIIAIEIFPIQFTLAFSVILILILSRKSDIQIFLQGLHREEIHAFISYALIAIVILPFLPDKSYSLSDMPQVVKFFESINLNVSDLSKIDIINPFKLWFIVVAITGIDMLGHVLERLIGAKRGRLLASIVGGFISSTATTISLAQESKTVKKSVNYLVTAAVFANVASFFPLLILISLINSNFLINAAPVLFAAIISGLIVGFYFFRKKDSSKTTPKVHSIKGIKESEIFALAPALKFGLLFLGVTIVTRIALAAFGNAGFLISSSIAALTGTDAVTINTANLVGKTINVQTAVLALILINSVNLIGKTIYSFIQGKKEFAVKFAISASIIILASFTGLFFT